LTLLLLFLFSLPLPLPFALFCFLPILGFLEEQKQSSFLPRRRIRSKVAQQDTIAASAAQRFVELFCWIRYTFCPTDPGLPPTVASRNI
jgi:hypothetical protein